MNKADIEKAIDDLHVAAEYTTLDGRDVLMDVLRFLDSCKENADVCINSDGESIQKCEALSVEGLKRNVEEPIGFDYGDFDIDAVSLLEGNGWDNCLDYLQSQYNLTTAKPETHEGWRDMSTAPKDGSDFYVEEYYRIPFRWKKYSPKSQQFKKGKRGRWQEMGKYGGWENSDRTPSRWTPAAPQPPEINLTNQEKEN